MLFFVMNFYYYELVQYMQKINSFMIFKLFNRHCLQILFTKVKNNSIKSNSIFILEASVNKTNILNKVSNINSKL